MFKKYSSEVIVIVTIVVLAAICILVFGGCMTAERAEKKLQKIYEKQPDVEAHFTRDKFPCFVVREKKDTTFLKGDSVTYYEMVQCPDVEQIKGLHDTIRVGGKVIKVPFKVASQIEYIHDKVTFEDSAKIFIANSAANKATTELNTMHDSRNFWRKWCIILGLIVAAIIGAAVLKLAKKLPI